MTYSIHQDGHFSVYYDGKLFLFVKRKGLLVTTSEFIKNGKTVANIGRFAFVSWHWLYIIRQSLDTPISLVRNNGSYVLFENENRYCVQYQSGVFEKEFIALYLNDVLQGSIKSRYLATLGGREYIMETEGANEKRDLLFLVLFIGQLNDI